MKALLSRCLFVVIVALALVGVGGAILAYTGRIALVSSERYEVKAANDAVFSCVAKKYSALGNLTTLVQGATDSLPYSTGEFVVVNRWSTNFSEVSPLGSWGLQNSPPYSMQFDERQVAARICGKGAAQHGILPDWYF